MDSLTFLQLFDLLAKSAIVAAALRAAFALGGWKQLGKSLSEDVKKLAESDKRQAERDERQDRDIARVSESLASVAAVVGQHDQWIHAQREQK